MILDFIWTRIKKELRKRILIVEEAWYLMQNEDSARFIYGIAKRARKYYLGLTTISQDVDDFLTSEYGKAIVTNSSISLLLKQHPAGIDKVAETFFLSEGEKRLLLSAGIGEGLFFAGSNHVAIKIMASEAENRLITTNPEELIRLREETSKPKEEIRPVYKQFKPQDSQKYETINDLKSTIVQPKPVTSIPSQAGRGMSNIQPAQVAQAQQKSEVDPNHMPSSSEILSSVKETIQEQRPTTPTPQPPVQSTQSGSLNINPTPPRPYDLK